MRIEVYGHVGGDRVSFEQALDAQCNELSIQLYLVDGNRGMRTTRPAVAVVFPGTGAQWTSAERNDFADLKDADYIVLPVIRTAPDAALLPTALQGFNAFQTSLWGNAWGAGLVDEVLSHGWQRRHERRVFISYKRSDSGPVANQLYDELTCRGYVTFLDDVSIGKGLKFQRELRWWLNDADAVLVLISPNFGNSAWCMEEVDAAKSSAIGLLGIQWPRSVFPDEYDNPPVRAFAPPAPSPAQPGKAPIVDDIDPDQRLRLDDADFNGSVSDPMWEQQLTADGLAKVLAHCARQRAQAIRLRLEDLVMLAPRVLNPAGTVKPTGAAGDFTFDDQSGDSCFVRVLPFRPDARSMHETYKAAGAQKYVGCLYSECDVNDPRAAAMRWLVAGQHAAPGGALRQTRIWACEGDRVAP